MGRFNTKKEAVKIIEVIKALPIKNGVYQTKGDYGIYMADKENEVLTSLNFCSSSNRVVVSTDIRSEGKTLRTEYFYFTRPTYNFIKKAMVEIYPNELF